ARMIHFSTDHVFDGHKDSPYVEEDMPDPVNIYGKSKLEGERGVGAGLMNSLIVRVSWLFGPQSTAFPDWVLKSAATERNFSLPIDKWACPTYTLDLAAWLEPLLFRENVTGILHLCNSDPCSWHDWGNFCL